MAWRAFVVFCFGVLLARAAARRMLGHNAGFDIVLLVILGSVLSRGINGDADFLPTLGASALLVALHHVASTLAFRCHAFSVLLKGRPHVLVRRGEPDREALCAAKITADDLDEHVRLSGALDLRNVAEARLERNGTISVVLDAPAGGEINSRRPPAGGATPAGLGQAGGAGRSTPLQS